MAVKEEDVVRKRKYKGFHSHHSTSRKRKYKGLEDPSEILSRGIYRTLFLQILKRRVSSFQRYTGEDEKEREEALKVLKIAGLVDASGNFYYPTNYGLRKARQLDMSETPRAWF